MKRLGTYYMSSLHMRMRMKRQTSDSTFVNESGLRETIIYRSAKLNIDHSPWVCYSCVARPNPRGSWVSPHGTWVLLTIIDDWLPRRR